MDEYVVENTQTEEQVDSFEEENIKEAIDRLVYKFVHDYEIPRSLICVNHNDDIVAHIIINLPYGDKVVYEVGDVE
jgi:hypothetical protein